jgi:hypothetical protein
MLTKFTTSINIIRDKGKNLNYIPTPNAIRIVNQIANDFKKGIRVFNIIGSYGTGKSAFLWALEESLTNNKKYFGINLLQNPTIDFLNIVGEYKSIKNVFAEILEVKGSKNLTENIFSEIYNKYHDLGKKNPILFIQIDEFGKFLEYASQNSPEDELYFIQQLAEFVNNPDRNIILLTTVHQNFDAYALGLSQTQKNEWTKVKGRYKEVTFNEPIEQLLFLAAEHLAERVTVKKQTNDISKIVALLNKSKAFSFNEDYVNEIAEKLYPLDVFASYVLTMSIQKYGQNERSLFSFLESTDHTGLFQHSITKEGTFYTVADVFDYLNFNHFSLLNSRYNPDFSAWKAIKASLEKAEVAFEGNTQPYFKLIKTVGLLNINVQAGANLDRDFLINYADKCLGIKNAIDLIADLEKKKIILYRNYNNRYILFEGTDLDIQLALEKAGGKVNEVTDVVTLLKKYYNPQPILAKRVMYETGSPRLFEYKISAEPISITPKDEIDGFVNLIFNEKLTTQAVKRHSEANDNAILYCYYKNSKAIKELLFEIEKTKKVIAENGDDKVAVRELDNIVLHQRNLLTHKIMNNFYGANSEVVWYFKGELLSIKNKKDFNSALSNICDEVYHKSPIFNNELVNKHKISPSIHTAKRNYFKALINNWDKPQLGFAADKFPPEKTIYLTLLENNNINLIADEVKGEYKPSNKNKFNDLWKLSLKFLDSAKVSRRNVTEFVDLLSQKPYKLKQGLIDFWIPTFLFIKRDDFALFNKAGYIPTITDEVLDLLAKDPSEFEIKTFALDGVKVDIFNSYRLFLNQNVKDTLSNESFIETIKPFLVFYKQLPEYALNTRRLSKEALAIRNAIANSKDPEQTFFDDFPLALGCTLNELQQSKKGLQTYIIKLQDAIRELRTCYDELVNRFETFIQNDIVGENISFEGYKKSLQKRYIHLKRHLLLPTQRVFVQRLDSAIDDRKAWLNSLVQSLVNNTLEKITDQDEVLIYDKFKSMIIELDSLTMLSKEDIKEDKEDVFDVQINTFFDGMSKKMIRMPKTKKAEVEKIQNEVSKRLSKDNSLNIVVLTNLLKSMLKNE